MDNKKYIGKIISKLSINTMVITSVIVGGFVVSKSQNINSFDYVKIGSLVMCDAVSCSYLVKKYRNCRKNTKKY